MTPDTERPQQALFRGRYGLRTLALKTCATCGKTKPVTSFRRATCGEERHHAHCRSCETQQQATASLQTVSAETPAEASATNTCARETRTNLGLAIAHALCQPGQRRTREELAAFADVTPEAIRQLEMRALRKVRAQLAEILQAAGYAEREVRL